MILVLGFIMFFCYATGPTNLHVCDELGDSMDKHLYKTNIALRFIKLNLTTFQLSSFHHLFKKVTQSQSSPAICQAFPSRWFDILKKNKTYHFQTVKPQQTKKKLCIFSRGPAKIFCPIKQKMDRKKHPQRWSKKALTKATPSDPRPQQEIELWGPERHGRK